MSIVEDTVEAVRLYAELAKEYSELVQDIAKLIGQHAQVELLSIDSQILLDRLKEGQTRVRAINSKLYKLAGVPDIKV